MPGNANSGRRPSRPPGSQAGVAILAWARSELDAGRPGAITRLAQRIGVDRGVLARWISGTAEPHVSDAIRLRDAIGVAVDQWTEPIAPRRRSQP